MYKSLQTLIRPFMSEKMISRQKRWNQSWREAEDFPLDIKRIPESLGGKLKDEDALKWVDDYFESVESVKF